MSNEIIKLIAENSAIAVAIIVIVFAGVRVLTNLKPSSPLAPYAIQIFAVVLLLPVILLLALKTNISGELIAGLLGTIVGFFFGGAFKGNGAE